MAGMTVKVHPLFGVDYGPASRFVPPNMQIQQKADPGGGTPSEPNAITFVEPDGESHVFLLNEERRRLIVSMLTGGVVLPGIEPA